MGHRLAAVLMADVVGYSRLMEADEAGTHAALKERRISVLEPTVRANGGRVVKVMGDGVLIEFGSAVNAVTGAVDLQRKMAEANVPLPEARRIVLRIGINLGEVIGEGGDIYGEGVNIAARLETLPSRVVSVSRPKYTKRCAASSLMHSRTWASIPSRTSHGRFGPTACAQTTQSMALLPPA